MQAFKIAVHERNFRILDVLIELTQQMVEGELLQMEKLGKPISLQEHLDLIYRKTACLFSVCMRVGAILGGATDEEEKRLGQYGRQLGLAFQIVDELFTLWTIALRSNAATLRPFCGTALSMGSPTPIS